MQFKRSPSQTQGLEDQRAPRPVEPEVLANDGDVLAREANDVPVHLASALEFADIRVDGPRAETRRRTFAHARPRPRPCRTRSNPARRIR